jgi:hypothetical protein
MYNLAPFIIAEESTSNDDSSLEGDEAAESDPEIESEEPLDDFEKLEYWTRKHFKHYRPRVLPDHVKAAYLCSPHPVAISNSCNSP